MVMPRIERGTSGVSGTEVWCAVSKGLDIDSILHLMRRFGSQERKAVLGARGCHTLPFTRDLDSSPGSPPAKVGTHIRTKRKREELSKVLADMRKAAAKKD